MQGVSYSHHVQVVENAEADYLVLRRALTAVSPELGLILRVTRALSVEEALGECRRGEVPDLVIADVHLSGETGLKLRARLRELLPKGSPPVVLTSSFPKETLPPEEIAGMDYLPKTLCQDALREQVRALLSRELAPPLSGSPTELCG